MKAERFNLINHEVRKNLINRILDIDCDGKIKVTISNIGTKSSRQQGLDYRWDSEIFKSGIGWHDDDVVMTHSRSKWLFARPILLRDDHIYGEIDNHFISKFGNNPEMCIEFARDYISTQKMSVSQAAEYMTNKQNFWTDKGVLLTDPSLYNLEFR